MFKSWRRKRQLAKVKPGNGSALQPYRWWQLFGRSVFFIELPEPTGKHTYAVDARYFQDELSDQEEDSPWSSERTDSANGDRAALGDTLKQWIGEGMDDVLSGSSKPRERSPAGAGSAGAAGGPTINGAKPGKAPAALYRDGVQLYRSKLPTTFPVPGGVIEVAANGFGASRMHFVDPQGNEQVLAPHHRAAEGLRARFDLRFPRLSKMIGILAILILLVCLVTGIPQGVEFLTSFDVISERFGTFTSPIQLPDWANVSLFMAGLGAGTERALTLRHHWLIDVDTTWTTFA